MIRSRTYIGTPGAFEIHHVSLRHVRILHVEREGTGHTVVSAVAVPTGRQVSYTGNGRLRFDENNPFNSTTFFSSDPNTWLEKIFVIYET